MKRIDTSTKAVDLFGAGKHGFKDGNKALGIPATKLDASLFNNVQEEISRVIEAAGIALDGAVYNQLLLALRSAGVFATPAQFDNDTKAATTGFVQRAIGGYGRMFGYSTAGQTIPANQANSHINIYGTCSSITLPLASSVPAGSVLMFDGVALTCTINRQGTNVIFLNGTNNTATSLAVNNGGSVMFTSDGTGSWFATGIATLKYTDEFAANLAVNGWQKLPGGLIVQWGTVPKTTASNVNVTWPIAFPNSVGRCIVGWGGSASPSAAISVGNPIVTGATFYSTGGSAGFDASYFITGW